MISVSRVECSNKYVSNMFILLILLVASPLTPLSVGWILSISGHFLFNDDIRPYSLVANAPFLTIKRGGGCGVT